MLKINETKTLKELREKGFYINAFCFYYEVNSICRIAFDMNIYSDNYLCYIGEEYSASLDSKKYRKEIKNVLSELKESGFVVEC